MWVLLFVDALLVWDTLNYVANSIQKYDLVMHLIGIHYDERCVLPWLSKYSLDHFFPYFANDGGVNRDACRFHPDRSRHLPTMRERVEAEEIFAILKTAYDELCN